MAKCRGCGGDTREFRGGPGWMHYECEIKRLNGLLEEADGLIDDLDKALPVGRMLDIANGDCIVVEYVAPTSTQQELCDYCSGTGIGRGITDIVCHMCDGIGRVDPA